MKTQYDTMYKTLKQVILATLVLTALVLLISERSEAAVRVKARIGSVRVTAGPDICCGPNAPAQRQVVVQSIGRQRVVVRNDISGRHSCGGPGIRNPHHRQSQVWVPGHYEKRLKRHGRLKKVWVPGHWVRR